MRPARGLSGAGDARERLTTTRAVWGLLVTPWHALSPDDVTGLLGVDPQEGLNSDDVAQRLAEQGPNRLAEPPQDPRWRAFLRQFQDLLIIILLVAAFVSLLVAREWVTPVAIALVVLLNAMIGFVQESRAEASLDALRQMTVTTATVRREMRLLRAGCRRAGARRCCRDRGRRPGAGRRTAARVVVPGGAGVLADW